MTGGNLIWVSPNFFNAFYAANAPFYINLHYGPNRFTEFKYWIQGSYQGDWMLTYSLLTVIEEEDYALTLLRLSQYKDI